MMDFLTVLLWILAIGAIIRLHTAFWTRYFGNPRFGDQVHFAQTADGWRIALHRYLPRERKYAEPLVLCHGMGANRHNFDMGDDRSLARELSARGFDVWVIELRGSGLSSRPRLFSRYKANYSFDDHLKLDIPSGIDLVRRVSGHESLFWIGHSMGGMLGYALSGQGKENGLAGLVTVSAPVVLSAGSARWTHHLIRPMTVGRTIAFRPVARFFSPFLGWGPGWISRIVVRPDGMEGSFLRRCMVDLTENTAGKLMRQFFSWIRSGKFESLDGDTDYLANLSKLEQPILIIAADADNIAVPQSVTPAYERIRSEDKQLRIFGTDRGDDHDFGHGDIMLGTQSGAIVYPEIIDWLEQRASERDPGNYS